ncbi:MAG: PSD1 and planctomycete cytochrome C domain-containing protein, partial [Verrucomicrobiales bacterium]
DTGPAVVPGDPEKSPIIEAVRYRNEDMAMPPKGKLPDSEIAILTEWVAQGADWPGVDPDSLASLTETEEPYDWEKFRREHWSFRPVTKSDLPEVSVPTWPKGEIDHFILAKLDAEKMRPNEAASKRMLVRRAYLDLIGLPPTTDQVQAFLKDEDPDAFAKVVDTLLESEHYGERWARHWLDVARYSDGLGGFLDNKPLPKAWRYRDWVVQALNRDMPYNEFVTRQIAGDMIEGETDPLGTGFFVVGPTYQSDGGDPEAVAQAEAETLSDRVDTFSRAFLGLTAACARCHDHKFDPITIKDYYAIAGIFRNSRLVEEPVVPQEEVDAYKAGQKAIKDQNDRVKKWLDHAGKDLGEKNHKKIEKALTEEAKVLLEALREELDRLKKSAPPKYEYAHVLSEAGDANMHVALRGDLRKKGELVPRRFVQILAGDEPVPYEHGSGRLELARSVTNPSNPLTPRVIVNRVWQWHFGKALVRTPSNFGVLGDKPTHPMLLDWLAADFVAHGWSLKRLHGQILLSSTWQMSSAFDQKKFDRDGGNRFLWRMNPRKLEAESWRDTLLAVTGELDRTLGGVSVNEILESNRRTLYATVSRNGDRLVSDEFLRLFDFPAPRSTSAARAVSTVPQQYLFMMNSAFMKARAQSLGKALAHEAGELTARIDAAYERLYSRPAEPEEIALGQAWLG